jgi:hypothetical protein
MKYIPYARVAGTLLALVLLTGVVAAQQKTAATPSVVQSIASKIQGRWILAKRTLPSGKEHQRPYSGEAVFKILVSKRADGTFVGEGTFITQETGAVDSAMSDPSFGAEVSNPDPNLPSQFDISATAAVVISEVRQAHAGPQAGPVVSIAYDQLFIIGNYGVFKKGLMNPHIDSLYRVEPTPAARRKRGRAASQNELVLMNQPRLQSSSDEKIAGARDDPSHQVKSMIITDTEMFITYVAGGKDYWVRKE